MCLSEFKNRPSASKMTFAARADELEAVLRPAKRYGPEHCKLGNGPRLEIRLKELLQGVTVGQLDFRDERGRPVPSKVIKQLDAIVVWMKPSAAAFTPRDVIHDMSA